MLQLVWWAAPLQLVHCGSLPVPQGHLQPQQHGRGVLSSHAADADADAAHSQASQRWALSGRSQEDAGRLPQGRAGAPPSQDAAAGWPQGPRPRTLPGSRQAAVSLGQSRCPAGRLTPHHPRTGRLAVAPLPLRPHLHRCLAHLQPSLPAHWGCPQALLLWNLLLSWPGLPPMRPALSSPRHEQQVAARRPAVALCGLRPALSSPRHEQQVAARRPAVALCGLRPALSSPRHEQQVAARRLAVALCGLRPSVGATPAAAGAAHCAETPSSLPCPALHRCVSKGVGSADTSAGASHQLARSWLTITSACRTAWACNHQHRPPAMCTTADLWQEPTGILLAQQSRRVAGCWPSWPAPAGVQTAAADWRAGRCSPEAAAEPHPPHPPHPVQAGFSGSSAAAFLYEA